MKTDLRKELAGYTARRERFDLVTIPPRGYLMIDGHGDPNTAERYSQALSTLYPVAYTLKFLSRRELDHDYVVPPLEGLWWADDMATFTRARDKDRWSWTAMILLPDWLDDAHVSRARESVAAKGTAPLLDDLRVETLDEGRCVQTLHVGPYDDEGPVLARMHEHAIAEQGLRMAGRHHEIYLTDPRRTAPERLRTILRQPVEAA